MNYYYKGMELLYDQAILTSYDGDVEERDAIFDELTDKALDIATILVSWGVSDDFAFWLGARRVVGEI